MTHASRTTLSAIALAAAAALGLVAPHGVRSLSAAATTAALGADTATNMLRFSPASLDLGELSIGTRGNATMTITNASDAPVTIAAITPACGCTKVGDAPKGPIAPGASFEVEISLDPGRKPGATLVRKVHVSIADGPVESFVIEARVKTAVRVEPALVEVVPDERAGLAPIWLTSADGGDFSVTGAVPAGVVSLADARSVAGSLALSVDLAAWRRAGRPTTIVLATDRADAPEIVVPIKSTDTVAMFRLPPVGGDVGRARAEAQQDAIVREIDAGLGGAARSPEFRVRLHRESGMLFVHGTAQDLDAVRRAVAALPASRGVRESGHAAPDGTGR